eukprot:scaffold40339_cov68-Phaeocystis_antarctica.AAC.2
MGTDEVTAREALELNEVRVEATEATAAAEVETAEATEAAEAAEAMEAVEAAARETAAEVARGAAASAAAVSVAEEEAAGVRTRQDEVASPPGTAQRDAPGAEDLACFPPQFPLRSGGGPVGKLCTLFAPRFADFYFEQRYRQHRAKGLDSVQLWFACAMVFYVVSLWVYYFADDDSYDRNVNMTLSSRQLRVELILPHAALFVAWATWAMLRALPCARARGSELQAVQVSLLVALFCWGLPATAKEMCSDTYNTFEGNLQQTLFMLLCYAAVFCRIGTDAFVMLCLVTVTNFIAARSAWKQLDTQPFALGFESPKIIATLVMVGSGVRWTDLHLRRDFAARELMLMIIKEQGREMEAALKVAATIGRELEAAAADELIV